MNKKTKKISVFMLISFVLLALYAVSLLTPLLWSLMTSFKGSEFDNDSFGWPTEFVNNYKDVFTTFKAVIPNPNGGSSLHVNVVGMVFNSLWYSIGAAIISTTVAYMVAYVVARFKFKFCNVIYTVIILQMIIPTVGTFPSEFRIANELHLYDTPHGILFMKSYVTGLYFLAFYAALRVIPRDYEEAAQLDGCGNWGIMLRIIVPMTTGVISTVFLLVFIAFWNDYQTPILYMPSYATLSYGLYQYVNTEMIESISVPEELAASMLLAIPLFVLFIIFQKKLLGRVSLGGLK